MVKGQGHCGLWSNNFTHGSFHMPVMTNFAQWIICAASSSKESIFLNLALPVVARVTSFEGNLSVIQMLKMHFETFITAGEAPLR